MPGIPLSIRVFYNQGRRNRGDALMRELRLVRIVLCVEPFECFGDVAIHPRCNLTLRFAEEQAAGCRPFHCDRLRAGDFHRSNVDA